MKNRIYFVLKNFPYLNVCFIDILLLKFTGYTPSRVCHPHFLLNIVFPCRVKIFLWQICHTQKEVHMLHLQEESELILQLQ
jgi:hypothetical protein